MQDDQPHFKTRSTERASTETSCLNQLSFHHSETSSSWLNWPALNTNSVFRGQKNWNCNVFSVCLLMCHSWGFHLLTASVCGSTAPAVTYLTGEQEVLLSEWGWVWERERERFFMVHCPLLLSAQDANTCLMQANSRYIHNQKIIQNSEVEEHIHAS